MDIKKLLKQSNTKEDKSLEIRMIKKEPRIYLIESSIEI